MPKLTKKFKREWDFFIHPKTGFVTCNQKCLRCINDCKQSYRVKIVVCPFYERKTDAVIPIKKTAGRKNRE